MKPGHIVSLGMFLLAPLGLAQNITPEAPKFEVSPLVEWPVNMGGNGHFYETVLFPNGIIWEEANTFAIKRGGHLVTLTSPEENEFVFALVDVPEYWTISGDKNYSVGPWLGGFQPAGSPEPGGGWEWVNGEGPINYFNWGSGQPDDDRRRANEDRLGYLMPGANRRGAEWNDEPAISRPHALIVEYDTNPHPPAPPALPALPAQPMAVATGAGMDSGVSGHGLTIAVGVVLIFALVTILMIWLQRKDKGRAPEGF